MSALRRISQSDRTSDGQILVIFAGGVLVLLLIAALVVDVGYVFMIRRQEQNAADPGALAAARYIQPTADTTRMREAACFYARQNGFFASALTDDECTPTYDANHATLTVNYPPSQSAGQYAGHAGYVEVAISRPHSAFFAGVIGLPTITVATSAVAAYDTGDSGSSSLIALNPTLCAAGKIAGGANVRIFPAPGVTASGGYVQVNSNCGPAGAIDGSCNQGSGQGGLDVDGTSSLTAPQIYVRGTCFGGGAVTGTLTEGASYVGDPLAGLQPPPITPPGQNCGSGQATTDSGAQGCTLKGTVTLNPGVYYGGWTIGTPSADVTLNPGIYIIAGGGIRQTGGALTSAGGRVLIYSTDDPYYASGCLAGTDSNPNHCQNVLNLNGASSLNLTGLDSSPCPPVTVINGGCPYAGMLIWQDGHGSNPGPVSLEGGASLYLSGTIYAPASQVKLTGNGVTSGCTPDASGNTDCAAVQIISDTFDIEGGADLEMPYDPNKLYHLLLKGLVR